MRKIPYTLVKRCHQCGIWFGDRKLNGTRVNQHAWAKRRVCSLRCRSLLFGAERKIPAAERFWPKVARAGKSACWLWLSGQDGAGYGAFTMRSKNTMRAHRAAFIFSYGPIPKGQVVRHRCDTPLCCNPRHLELGTAADNTFDMWARNPPTHRRRDTGHGGAILSTERYEAMLAEYDQIPRHPSGVRKSAPGQIQAIADRYGVTYSTLTTYAHRRYKCPVKTEKSVS